MDKNLSTAWRYFLIELAVFLGASLVLTQLGYPFEWLLIPLWLFNLLPALYVARAARALGKNAAFYGIVAALGPPGMFFVLTQLRSSALFAQLDRGDQ